MNFKSFFFLDKAGKVTMSVRITSSDIRWGQIPHE